MGKCTGWKPSLLGENEQPNLKLHAVRKIFVQFPCVGQPKTCCHSPSHFANACHSIICFNCEKISEESDENTPLAKRIRI